NGREARAAGSACACRDGWSGGPVPPSDRHGRPGAGAAAGPTDRTPTIARPTVRSLPRPAPAGISRTKTLPLSTGGTQGGDHEIAHTDPERLGNGWPRGRAVAGDGRRRPAPDARGRRPAGLPAGP